jgi:hypothetical protein
MCRRAGFQEATTARSGRRRTHPLVAGMALCAVALAPVHLKGQAAPARWTVERDAFADLWYHGLATIGARSDGPLPLYSATHMRAVGDRKRTRDIATRLDALAPALRTEFAADSAYEVLHFIPAFFVRDDPIAVLGALRAALSGAAARSPAPFSLAARAAAVARSFPSTRQRRALLSFMDALDDEWRNVVRQDRGAWAPRLGELAALRRDWDEQIGPPLASYLGALVPAGGMIVVVSALGAEGRIVVRPGGRSVVVVSADSVAGVRDAPLLAAVRELAYPLLDRAAWTSHAPRGDRLAAERARRIAAVRGGAILLEALAPALAPAYQRAVMAATDHRRSRRFESEYPMDDASQSALRAAAERYAVLPVRRP